MVLNQEPVEPRRTGRIFRLLWLVIRWLPARRGSRARASLLRRAGAAVGERVVIGPRVAVLGPSGLRIGDDVGIARDALLDARAGLDLEDGAMIGFEAVLLTFTHRYDDPYAPISEQGAWGSAISIGANTWVGTRSIVLPGISIGRSVIVGAGSVVTKSVPDGEVVAGNPARHIRER